MAPSISENLFFPYIFRSITDLNLFYSMMTDDFYGKLLGFTSALLNEIMPMIYKRFTDKSAEEWRQIYKVSVARDRGSFFDIGIVGYFSRFSFTFFGLTKGKWLSRGI